MQIDIISDTICPWCFIGKRRLERALAERPDLVIAVRWHPFQLNPEMPKDGMERQAYIAAKFGAEANGAEIYARVAAAGQGEGIPFNFESIPRTPNTLDSHRLIHWAGEDGAETQDRVVEMLFRRYFIEGVDIGAHNTLIAVANEAGMDSAAIAEALAGDADREFIEGEDQHVRTLGINAVPCFIFERKFAFSGAQEPAMFLKAFERVAAEAESGGS